MQLIYPVPRGFAYVAGSAVGYDGYASTAASYDPASRRLTWSAGHRSEVTVTFQVRALDGGRHSLGVAAQWLVRDPMGDRLHEALAPAWVHVLAP